MKLTVPFTLLLAFAGVHTGWGFEDPRSDEARGGSRAEPAQAAKPEAQRGDVATLEVQRMPAGNIEVSLPKDFKGGQTASITVSNRAGDTVAAFQAAVVQAKDGPAVRIPADLHLRNPDSVQGGLRVSVSAPDGAGRDINIQFNVPSSVKMETKGGLTERTGIINFAQATVGLSTVMEKIMSAPQEKRVAEERHMMPTGNVAVNLPPSFPTNGNARVTVKAPGGERVAMFDAPIVQVNSSPALMLPAALNLRNPSLLSGPLSISVQMLAMAQPQAATILVPSSVKVSAAGGITTRTANVDWAHAHVDPLRR